MFICEFCNKELATISSLNSHKKNTRYCLLIQGKENKSFQCICEKVFTSKKNLEKHEEKCDNVIMKKKIIELENNLVKYKKVITEKEKIINKLKIQSSSQELDIKKLKIMIEEKDKIIETMASRPITTNNLTTNNLTTTNNIQVVNINIDSKDITDNIDKLNDDHITDGIQGIAEFMAKEVFPKENGKYICTDKARKIFKYKNDNGEVIKDPNCRKLIQVSQPIFKSKLNSMHDNYEVKLDEYVETDYDKKSLIGGKDLLKFKLNKISETKDEVIDMHKNSKFANYLSDHLVI